MPNINLLPDDLREAEEKELRQVAKKPIIEEVELSQVEEKDQAKLKSDKPKVSWWKKIMGEAPKKAVTVKKAESVEPVVPSMGSDILKQARKQRISWTKPKKQKKVKVRQPVLGKVSPLIKPVEIKDYEKPQPKLKEIEPVVRQEKRIEVQPKVKKKFRLWGKPKMAKPKVMPVKMVEPPKPVVPQVPKIEPIKIEKRGQVSIWQKLKDYFSPRADVKSALKLKESDLSNRPPLPKLPEIEPLPEIKPVISKHKIKPIKKQKIKPIKLKVKKESWLSKVNKWLMKQMQKQPMITPPPPSKEAPEASKPKSKYHVVEEPMEKRWGGVNLLPGMAEQKKMSSTTKTVGLSVAIIIPILLLVGWYFLIGFQEQLLEEKITMAEKQMEQAQSQIEAKRNLANKNAFLEKKMLAIKGLLDDHIYWTNFFNLLEKYTLDNVYYTDFSADISGQISLPAVAGGSSVADRYRTIAEQLEALKQADDFIKDVSVSEVALEATEGQGITGASFEIELTLVDGVFTQ